VSKLRFLLSGDHSENSSIAGDSTGKLTDDETSLERIHTFNLKAQDSNKSSMVSQKGGGGGSTPSSPSEKSTGSKDELPERKFKNFRTLLSMKVAASEQKLQANKSSDKPTAESSQARDNDDQ